MAAKAGSASGCGHYAAGFCECLEVAEFSAKSLVMAAPAGKLHPITDKEVEDLRVAFHVGE